MNAPLLLLHGFTGSRADFAPLRQHLPQYETITLDLPGHGDNPLPAPYTMAQAAADVVMQMQELVGKRTLRPRSVQAFHLLGYSMGGRLALYIAIHYPDSIASLTLESASPGLATAEARQQRRQRDNALADRIERDGISAFVDFWENLSLWESQTQLSDEIRAALRGRRLQNNPIRLADSLRGMGTGVQPSLWPRLGELRMPVHLIVGALDHKFVAIAQEMARAMGDVRLDVVAGAGHTVHLERPLIFAELVNQRRLFMLSRSK